MGFINKSLIILTLVTSTKSTNTNLLIEPATKKYDSATDCLLSIVEKDFRSKSTVLLYQQEEITTDESIQFFDEMTVKLIKDSIPKIYTDLRNLIETDYIYYENVMCLIYFENCEQLKKFQYQLIDESIIFIVVINNYSDDSCSHPFSKIGRATCEYNILFLTINPVETEHKIFTFLPEINSTTCEIESKKPIQLNKCFHNVTGNDVIFPEKSTRNLHKCSLNVGIAELQPYIVIPNNAKMENMKPAEEIRGCDYEIIRIIADYLNATLCLYHIQTRFRNGTADSQFIELLKNNTLDICAGGLFRVYGTEVKYSGIYSRQVVVWAYTVERMSRSWKELINKLNGLYIFFLFYLYYSFIWYLLSKFDKQKISLHKTLMYTWGMLLGTAYLKKINRSMKQKFVNGVFLIMCIHLASYVNIQLYCFLTINEPPPILKTNQDVMESGRPAFPGIRARHFTEDSRLKDFFNHSEHCTFFHDCADKTWKAKGAAVLLDAQFLRFQLMTASETEARVMRPMDPIITLFHEMPVRQNALVLEYFRRAMTRLKEAGIHNRLYQEELGLLNMSKAQILTKNMMSNSYSCTKGCSIKIDQIAGGFYIWMLGCSVSCLVFFAEIMSKIHEKMK